MEKRIVMANKEGKVLDLFNNLEEASSRTGFKKGEILRCLLGTQSYIGKKEIHFFYEVTAGELRAQNAQRRREKEEEKIKKEWGEI